MSEKTQIPRELVEKAKEKIKIALENLQYKRTWESFALVSDPEIELAIGFAITHARTVIGFVGHYLKATSRYYIDLEDLKKVPEALRRLADELEKKMQIIKAIEIACKEIGLSTKKIGSTRRQAKTVEL